MTDEEDTAWGIVISIMLVVFVLVTFMSGSGVNPWLTGFVAAVGALLGPLIMWVVVVRPRQRIRR